MREPGSSGAHHQINLGDSFGGLWNDYKRPDTSLREGLVHLSAKLSGCAADGNYVAFLLCRLA